jgi:hypothetical protein
VLIVILYVYSFKTQFRENTADIILYEEYDNDENDSVLRKCVIWLGNYFNSSYFRLRLLTTKFFFKTIKSTYFSILLLMSSNLTNLTLELNKKLKKENWNKNTNNFKQHNNYQENY